VGDLNMYSTSIASLNGGNIAVNVGGDVNVGSSVFTVTALQARGIFSTRQGDVSVIANGDINVNGSRIATYDGGNVTVESLNGDVNAGSGGTGFVNLTAYYVNPITHQVFIASPTIPGSGILTTTFPARDARYPAPTFEVGSILVEAPNGDINANAGGIVQLPLNHVNNPDAFVDVLAGYELHNTVGQAVNATTAKPIVELFAESPPGPTDPARLVLLNGAKIQASINAWSFLLTLLGLPDTESQVITLNVTGNKMGLASALTGDGSGLNNFDYFSTVSPHRDINASGSGVIGNTVTLKATGDIVGVIFARDNLNVSAVQNVNVTALSEGVATVGGGESVSGSIIGIGGVNASGANVDASLLSNNGITGATSGQTGLAQGTAANATSTAASANDDTPKAAVAATDDSDDDKKKEKKEGVAINKTGRVTVLLPKKT